MDLISSFTVDVASKALDGLSQRQLVMSSNLANVDTPGYKHKQVQFEGTLQRAILTRQGENTRIVDNDHELPMFTSSADHLSNGFEKIAIGDVTPEVTETDVQYRNDGNAVDIEKDMAMLAKNTEHYLALANVQGRMFKQMRSVITNGGN